MLAIVVLYDGAAQRLHTVPVPQRNTIVTCARYFPAAPCVRTIRASAIQVEVRRQRDAGTPAHGWIPSFGVSTHPLHSARCCVLLLLQLSPSPRWTRGIIPRS